MLNSPAFGQADLTNCERELIHLAGSVQPHGVLLVLREGDLRIVQASANVTALLGVPVESLLGQSLAELGGDVEPRVRQACGNGGALSVPLLLRCRLQVSGGVQPFEGTLHKVDCSGAGPLLLAELEPQRPPAGGGAADAGPPLREEVTAAVQRLSSASSIGTLADGVVRSFRDLFGYDRVMVYQFDRDGHGKIIAEARDPRLESLLGHHYPASDIPQRARELYLRNRLRVLVDVHYQPSPLVPRRPPGAAEELDMSLCQLRSMSPLHLQYLKNMGVTATLVVSLVRQGRLWGLVACHHYAPRNLRFDQRAAADLLAEVASTRIAAIENYAHAQVAIQVRRLEQRLVEATSTEGDWRLALFRNPRTLLQPLEATGAALFHDGELLTAGEAPSTAELRALLDWIDARSPDALFSCSSIGSENPALAPLTPTASGVLAVRLSASRPDYLMWFRKEQLLTVTWAGDPTKPVVGNDPLELSPRRSFAAWSEIVRGTALPWSDSEIALGRAFGASLVDIIVQVNAVRLLIAEHQLAQIRTTVASSNEPVMITGADGRELFANDAFVALCGRDAGGDARDMTALFTAPDAAQRMLESLRRERAPWRGELELRGPDGKSTPVAVRAEVVTARDGSTLGFFFVVVDLSDSRRVAAARRQLEESLTSVSNAALSLDDLRALGQGRRDELVKAVLANASLSAMDIADGGATAAIAPLLEELETSARRAAELCSRIAPP